MNAGGRPGLGARALAEGLGTGLLVAAVVGSGIAAERLSPGDAGLQLLENSAATVLALLALILTFSGVSGAHLNPAVTLVELVSRRVQSRAAVPYVGAQIVGGCAGAMLANLMYELPAVDLSTHDRLSSATFLAEVVATFGLVMVVVGVSHSARPAAMPVAVAGYIGAAYWFTSSTSFANPAVTVARTLTDSFAGIRPASAPGFIGAQLLGAAFAVAVSQILFPAPRSSHDGGSDG